MKKLSRLFNDRPMTPQESVVYWTEYVIRHSGAPHLQSAARNLNWFQYLLIDVITFVIIVLFTAIILLYLAVKLIMKFLRIFPTKSRNKEGKYKFY